MENERTDSQVGRVSIKGIPFLSFLLLAFLLVGLSSCRSSQIKQAELADKAKLYTEASSLYQKLYRTTTRKEPEQKAYFAFKAAENYYAARNFSRALGLYASALSYGLPDSIVLLRLAACYRSTGKPQEAQSFYQRFLAVDSLCSEARIGLESLRQRTRISENRYNTRISKSSLLSSVASDFAGCFTPNGDSFYFTSARSRSDEVPFSAVTGEKQNRLYVIRKNAQGKWSRPDSVPGGINSKGDLGTPAISPDGTSLYYSFVEDNEEVSRTVKIYKAAKSGEGGWSEGKELPIWSDSLRMAAHPTLSGDGKTLYFVSDGGYGGTDLYSIEIEKIGSGIPPVNLGFSINTAGNELFPTAVGDSMLYFSSDGKIGLGSYDLYVARKDKTGSWRVSNLGFPFNSEGDDFSIAFNPHPAQGLSHEGYFATTRHDRRGYPHLYSFSREAIVTLLEGFVLDREENPIEGAIVRIVSKNNPTEEQKVSTRSDGYFTAELQGETEYLLHASHPDYLNQYTSFRTDSAAESSVYAIDFFLASRLNSEVFQDIFYDFDKAELREESKHDLDEMVKILIENPEVAVEISSHADRIGSDAYNIALSEARARSVVQYLVKRGINKARLNSKGYGKNKPRGVTPALKKKYPFLEGASTLDENFLKNLTKEEVALCDQLNRRTEFSVVR